MRNAYKVFVAKPEGKRKPLGRSRCRWDDNIRMDLKERDCQVCGPHACGTG
jgi:hypothetical protein